MHSYLRISKRAAAKQEQHTAKEQRGSSTRTPQFGQPHILAKMQEEVNGMSGFKKTAPKAQPSGPRKRDSEKAGMSAKKPRKLQQAPGLLEVETPLPSPVAPGLRRPRSVAAGEVVVATKRRRRIAIEHKEPVQD